MQESRQPGSRIGEVDRHTRGEGGGTSLIVGGGGEAHVMNLCSHAGGVKAEHVDLSRAKNHPVQKNQHREHSPHDRAREHASTNSTPSPGGCSGQRVCQHAQLGIPETSSRADSGIPPAVPHGSSTHSLTRPAGYTGDGSRADSGTPPAATRPLHSLTHSLTRGTVSPGWAARKAARACRWRGRSTTRRCSTGRSTRPSCEPPRRIPIRSLRRRCRLQRKHEGRSGSLAALVAEATGMLEQAAEAERARVAAGLGSCKYGITLSSPSSVGASVGVVFWWPEEEEERRLTRRCL